MIRSTLAGGALLMLAACGTQQAPEPMAPAGPTSTQTADLSESIRVLASDEFGGRGPTSEGEQMTVDYVSRQWAAAGFEPAGANGSWVQPVTLRRFEMGAPEASISVGGRMIRLDQGEEITMSTRLPDADGRVEMDGLPLVFVGYGTNAPERNWNDFDGIDVRGKIIVVLINDADFEAPGLNTFNGAAMTYYGRWTYKFEEAARQGAAAALIIHETAAASYGWDVVFNSWSGPQYDLPSSVDPSPKLQVQGWISGPAAERIFSAAGQDLPALVEAALLMIITLVQGLAQAMPTLIPMIATIIPQIVLILLDNLPLLIEPALQLILALAQGLVAALPILIPAIPVIVQAIFDALIVALPMIATAAGELIATLAMGMIAAIPGVINAVMQITASIRDFFFNSGPSMLEIGKAIVDGIWRGIQNQKAAFMANIRAFFADLINTVKDSIGWHSPAAVFVPGGESIPQAFSVGIKKGMPELDRDLRQAMFGLQRTVDISANVSTETPRAGNGGLRPSISFGDIIVDARGAKDPQAVGRAVGDGLVDRLRSLGVI